MKLIAIDQTPERIVLIFSDPEKGEVIDYEFSLDDPELEKKLMPYVKEPLLRKHLDRHPEVIGRKKAKGGG
jgi:hypothetical protein